MPNPITHVLFARKVAEELNDSCAVRRIIDAAPAAYELGALGPDYLFVLRELRLCDKSFVSRMHSEKCIETLNAFALAGDGVLNAYALGFATHYVLDSTLHPYVFFEALQIEKNVSAGEALSPYGHQLIECALDGLFLAGMQGDVGFRTPTSVVKKVAAFMAKKVHPLYSENVSRSKTAFSFRMLGRLLRFTQNVSGKSKERVRRAEDVFFKGKRKFSVMLQPPDADERIDALNGARRPFPSVKGGKANRVMSVKELIASAKGKAVPFLEKTAAMLSGSRMFTSQDMPLDYEGNILN